MRRTILKTQPTLLEVHYLRDLIPSAHTVNAVGKLKKYLLFLTIFASNDYVLLAKYTDYNKCIVILVQITRR